jgi:tetratricopeptide (TPR) repeat protein
VRLRPIAGRWRRRVARTDLIMPDKAETLNAQGVLLMRQTQVGDAEGVGKAITLFRAAVEAAPVGSTAWAEYSANLGVALKTRYEILRQPGDSVDAMDALEAAHDRLPVDHPLREALARVMNEIIEAKLGVRLPGPIPPFDLTRGQSTSMDLDKVITLQRKIAEELSGHDSEGKFLDAFADALMVRYEHTGRTSDLDEAVIVCRRAIQLTPPGHHDLGRYLTGLGVALGSRYIRTGQTEALDEALDAFRQAIDATPTDHPSRPGRQSNCGWALLLRFELTHQLKDLNQAVSAFMDAVQESPFDATRPRRLSELGKVLIRRYEVTREGADLMAGLRKHSEAVEGAPAGHPHRPMCLSNSAAALIKMFEVVPETDYLKKALAMYREAVQTTSADHPERASYLFGLGMTAEREFSVTDAHEARNQAMAAFQAAWETTSATIGDRARAAREWGRLAADADQTEIAADALGSAVGALSLLAWQGLKRDDQERLIAEFHGLASDAAASAIASGQPELAVELLEQGRGVLLGQAIDARTEYDELYQHIPGLAERLARTHAALEQPIPFTRELSSSSGFMDGPAEIAQRRHDLARERQEVIAEIRELPAFADFLAPPKFATLKAAADSGPVVIINVCRYRCDALIITPDRVRVTPLPDLNIRDVVNYARELSAAESDVWRDLGLMSAKPTGPHAYAWMWDTIAAPILDDLGLTGRLRPGERWPRIWWCPTGLLTFFPLHAAGHHQTRDDAQPLTVMDRVVSSYTPTLRGLLHARRRTPPAAGTRAGPLVVAMPGDLPGASRELADLYDRFPNGRQLVGQHATRQAVQNELNHHPWVHFACHGMQDINDPRQGRLLLNDDPLTVRDITALRLDQGELAFLSACQTARGGIDLADEAITLAASLQLAGFRHVIGTLWSISDTSAPDVARDFYAHLADHDPDPGSGSTPALLNTSSAEALHLAVHNLRSRHLEDPGHWAAFIHTGA